MWKAAVSFASFSSFPFTSFVWCFSPRVTKAHSKQALGMSILLGEEEVPPFTLSGGQHLTFVYLTACSRNNRLLNFIHEQVSRGVNCPVLGTGSAVGIRLWAPQATQTALK